MGVVQQDLCQAQQVRGTAPDKKTGLCFRLQRQATLKKERFKGQNGFLCQLAEINPVHFHAGGAAVRAGQLQHVLCQAAHAPGHDQNVLRKLRPVALAAGRVLQQLRIGQDHRQGCFQFMGGIGNELLLLRPGSLYRVDEPAGEKNAQQKKDDQCRHADEQAGLDQGLHGAALAGNICKDNSRPGGRKAAVVAQVIAGEQAAGGSRGCGGRH